MKTLLLSLLAIGTLLVLLMFHLSQPSSLDVRLERAMSDWNRKMDRLFEDFPWKQEEDAETRGRNRGSNASKP